MTESTRLSIGRVIGVLLKTLLPVVALVVAVLAFQYMMKTAPKAERKQRERNARLVEVQLAERYTDRVHIFAKGVVQPARRITLSPQVTGEVIWISDRLVPGGRFRHGEEMLRIDPRDYEYAVQQRESAVTQARASLTLEQGNQQVAQREYEILGEELSEADQILVFRKPQLESAQGDVAAAESMLRAARLDLERTTLTAPFDALVTTENVDLGAKLSTQTAIAELVGTDTYWVELSVRQSDLQWVVLPTESDPGSLVILRQPAVWGANASREGHVIRLLPELSDRGSMARLLVAVKDPLAMDEENAELPMLLIDQYLEVEIVGRQLEGVLRVPREHLRDGDNVWIMNGDNKLEVRPLDIAYRGPDAVLVRSGIVEGDRIVTTALAMGVPGMPLRLDGDNPPSSEGEGPGRTAGSDS